MSARYPFSAGTGDARQRAPDGACDCHVHVYDGKTPAVVGAVFDPPPATIGDYRHVQQRIGTTRAVLVTPSTYGTNNAPMLAGLAQLGRHGRGIAVIDGRESAAHLADLHAQGVRGVRINLSLGTVHDAHAIGPLAERIAPLGWHLQLLMPPTQLARLAPLLSALPVDLVFDHFARLRPEDAHHHPAHALVLDRLAAGRAWIKLSGAYLVSDGVDGQDAALPALARTFLDTAPDRVIWGSDWPHASASAGRHCMPDDARLFDQLARWTPDDTTWQAVLVHNPARLYGFEPAPATPTP